MQKTMAIIDGRCSHLQNGTFKTPRKMKIYIVKWTFYEVKHTKPAIYNNQNRPFTTNYLPPGPRLQIIAPASIYK